MPIEAKSSGTVEPVVRLGLADESEVRGGALIINADDWGRNRETSERILECVLLGSVSSTSAMVFMEDSERSAALAQEHRIDAGLHLNLTAPFSAACADSQLCEHQRRVSRYLRTHRLAQAIFNPWLASSFEYLVAAQIEEFNRLYGAPPQRIDGHHHMHLCANVLFQRLLPAGTIVRRNFSFQPGEKSRLNRLYRYLLDRTLEKRYRLADLFFSLTPIHPSSRVEKILSLATQFTVELETHPISTEEYRFLTEGEILRCVGDVRIAPCYSLPATHWVPN